MSQPTRTYRCGHLADHLLPDAAFNPHTFCFTCESEIGGYFEEVQRRADELIELTTPMQQNISLILAQILYLEDICNSAATRLRTVQGRIEEEIDNAKHDADRAGQLYQEREDLIDSRVAAYSLPDGHAKTNVIRRITTHLDIIETEELSHMMNFFVRKRSARQIVQDWKEFCSYDYCCDVLHGVDHHDEEMTDSEALDGEMLHNETADNESITHQDEFRQDAQELPSDDDHVRAIVCLTLLVSLSAIRIANAIAAGFREASTAPSTSDSAGDADNDANDDDADIYDM